MTGTPQQERSRLTRQRLLDATVACLAELGWTGTTVGVVAERAGVSRGAAQHHFRTRMDLLSAVVDEIIDVRLTEMRRIAETASRPSTEAVLERLAGLYSGQLFRAFLHVWVAASVDEQLRARVVPLEARLGREAHRLAVELLGADESRPGVRETVQATLDLARGLGLAALLTDDSTRRARVLRSWAPALDAALGPHPAVAAPPAPSGQPRR
ncbi:MAG: TetR family transcriptional regulator [Pseudonocardiaceae bacterium]|nr:TetR family transcriptional regulator [Pseudonocardiaceae bacterium]